MNPWSCWIERELLGSTAISFDSQRWTYTKDERCIQIQDLISEGQVGWGDFEYRVRVFPDPDFLGEPIAAGVRQFTAISPTDSRGANHGLN